MRLCPLWDEFLVPLRQNNVDTLDVRCTIHMSFHFFRTLLAGLILPAVTMLRRENEPNGLLLASEHIAHREINHVSISSTNGLLLASEHSEHREINHVSISSTNG